MSERETRDTWSTLLSDLQSSLEPQDPIEIPNENKFHQAFEEVCTQVHECDRQRLLAKFLRQHDQIIVFIGALDESIGFTEPHCLSSLFWSVAFTTVQIALRREKKTIIFAENLPKLNEALPAFGAQLPLFPDVPQVQDPLQKVFREYIECYSVMLTHFSSHPTPISFQSFDDRIDPARTVFGESKRQWEEMVKEEKNRLASIPSFPNGSLGNPLHPYAPSRVSFEWVETLGHGAYGQVSKVRQLSTGRIYAQKVIRVSDPRLRSRIEKEVENEVSIMERLPHLHIASLVFYDCDGDTFSILMLPVADYDLLQFLRKCINGLFPRTELTYLTSWFGCLVSALAFAHSRKIKHEDIKPTNILIKDHQPYLADFGCAQDFSELERSTSTDILAFGTPVYWAPENPPRGRTADIFSLGCVFSEMITVRQSCTLDDYQRFRYLPNRDNPYAFRGNLPQVYKWLEQLKRPNDAVGELLIEQTLKMLKQDKDSRPDAKDIKRGLRPEGDAVFCSTCY
ncbi:hypothetical protein MMC22_004166 [Lobaria immixta]|nr:hypothetical protein [Lobaria immixta]